MLVFFLEGRVRGGVIGRHGVVRGAADAGGAGWAAIEVVEIELKWGVAPVVLSEGLFALHA